MKLSEYEDNHPQRTCAPKYETGEVGFCEGDCPSCDGRGEYWWRNMATLSPSDAEWRSCERCEGSGRVRLEVDVPGYGGPGSG